MTVDWHVFADGAWRVEALEAGSVAPVNVYVTADRMAPVVYRHQAGECRGECVLTCGHPVAYGCDCDTIAAEACQGDVRPVWRLVCSVCGDTRPDADVEGEGVSRGARCGYVVCEGFYRDPDAAVTADQERAAVYMCTYSSRIDRPTTCPLDLV